MPKKSYSIFGKLSQRMNPTTNFLPGCIALNVAISFYRKEIRALSFKAYSEEIITINTTPEIETEADPNLDLLQQFIQELSEIDKSVILLYLDEKSYKEIAEITGITETNVATKINRIKKKLKSKF